MAFDLELTSLNVPARVLVGEVTDLSVTVTNISTAVSAAGDVTVLGISNRGDVAVFNATVPPLDGGETIVVPVTEPWTWPAPGDKPTTFNWSAVVDAEGDTNPSNDSATGRTKVRKN